MRHNPTPRERHPRSVVSHSPPLSLLLSLSLSFISIPSSRYNRVYAIGHGARFTRVFISQRARQLASQPTRVATRYARSSLTLREVGSGFTALPRREQL